MRFKFLPLGAWRVTLLLTSLALYGLGGLLLWEGYRRGWEGFSPAEILLGILTLGGGSLLLFLLVSLRDLFVEVSAGQIRIKAGFLLDAIIPFQNIRGAEPSAHSFLEGIGVRMSLNGTLAVISSNRNIVQINLKEPQSMGFATVRLTKAKRIKLSLEEPQAFLSAVRAQVEGKHDQPGTTEGADRGDQQPDSTPGGRRPRRAASSRDGQDGAGDSPYPKPGRPGR